MCSIPITVSARVGFATVDQISDRLRGVDFAIELALPYTYDWWRAAAERFDEMLSLLEQAQVKVSTVHATQGRITDANFLRWGRQTIEIAERLDARAITVHPNGVERRMKRNFQKVARGYLRQLQRHTDVIISVETFAVTAIIGV